MGYVITGTYRDGDRQAGIQGPAGGRFRAGAGAGGGRPDRLPGGRRPVRRARRGGLQDDAPGGGGQPPSSTGLCVLRTGLR